ncbi:MAG: swr complex subunit [Bogoriella megaspora]|nr:MAG: swr complex subunit [Bogoriella megaspora]
MVPTFRRRLLRVGGENAPPANISPLTIECPNAFSLTATRRDTIAGTAHVMEDDNYLSEEDEDFDPSLTVNEEADSSSDEQVPKRIHTNKHVEAKGAEDLDFTNSGDEATIQSAKAKRRRKAKERTVGKKVEAGESSSAEPDLLDEEGGDGGFIRTRAQRKADRSCQKKLQGTEGATVNVDSVWDRLISAPLKPSASSTEIEKGVEDAVLKAAAPKIKSISGDHNSRSNDSINILKGSISTAGADRDTITIKRTYDFAGEVHTEEKRVHKDSEEARLYLATQDTSKGDAVPEPQLDSNRSTVRRPLKRLSQFEPNTAGEIKNVSTDRLPRTHYPIMNMSIHKKDALTASANINTKAPRLNVVTKSKLDWAGFVDQEGIAEDLKDYQKGGKAYLDRMEFLGRVGDRKDAEVREAKGGVF